MKKIWPWLLLLLLLIIFCVWTKKDSMHINTANTIQNLNTPEVKQEESHAIEFVLLEKNRSNTLNGVFTNVNQQDKLRKICAKVSRPLRIEKTSTNAALIGDDAIDLTKKILPHFLAHYTKGSIRYSNQQLKIDGVADSYQSQRKMQRLLNTSTLLTQDNSSVMPAKPIDFSIDKNAQKMHFKGIFGNKNQIHSINTKLLPRTTKRLRVIPHRVDNGVIATTKTILPEFTTRYTQGSITYHNEVFVVSGMVETEEDLAFMKELLSAQKITIVNKTTLDTNVVSKQKEAAKLAEAEAEARKKAAQEAKNKALEAAKLAEEEKARNKALEEEAKRQAMEKKKAEALQEQQAKQVAKEKIIQLLQIENIEFETGKGVLTIKGKATVDKLAKILNQYPHIRVEIAGHTDSDGSASFNQKLSQSRVETVKAELIKKDVDGSRLTAKGYGETKPLVPNTTDENKQKNRRVEINILGE